MKPICIFYVDPMSYHNLAGYDYELLSKMDKAIKLHFYANKKFNMDIPHTTIKKIYRYADKKGISKGLSYIFSQIQLLHDIKKIKPAIVHFQWLKIPILDYFFLRMIKKYAKVVYTSHDAFTHSDEKKQRQAYIKILQMLDAVIVHTGSSKQALNGILPEEKIFCIKHGLLNLSAYHQQLIDLSQYKKELGLGSEIIFSALGTMDFYKGTDLLLAAWESSKILREAGNLKLIIAGKNKMGLNAQAFQAKNIIFIDRFIPDEEFDALLQLSDLVLLPYRQISQSGLLLSALAAEKKVLVSQAGELSEAFQYGDIGWILTKTDSDELRSLLEQIYTEANELLKPLDHMIWMQIKKAYSWEEIALETSQLYQALKV